MRKKRASVKIEFDLDPVPGWGNNVEDWQKMLQHQVNDMVPHYNPVVTVLNDGEEN